MKHEAELKKVIDEVYRKIGRNILLIQSIEQILKKLIVINGHAIKSSGDNLEQRLADIYKKTMGNLVGEFHEAYFGDQMETSKKEVEPEEPQLLYGFRIKGDDFYAQLNRSLASIVDERNKLVHHFLQDLYEGIKGNDGNEIKGWNDVDRRLDKLHDKLVSEYKNLDKLRNLVLEVILKNPSDEELLFSTAVSDKRLLAS